MTDNYLQPTRPHMRGSQHYKSLHQEIISQTEPNKKELFTIVINAAREKGTSMNQQPLNEQQFLIDLIFKPNEARLKLRPQETQLLLAYIGEILKEIEEEEKLIT